MTLADATTTIAPTPSLILTLDGVTTVLVLFTFVCLVMPSLVRNRTQFYAGLVAVLGIILVHTLSIMFDSSTGPLNLFAVATGVLQFAGLMLYVLCVGGLTAKELAGDMARAYEVLRRGETQKEVIIPIGDQPRRGKAAEPSNKVYKIDTGAGDEDEDGGIPLS